MKNKHNTIGKGSSQRAVNGGEDKYYTKEYLSNYLIAYLLDTYKGKFTKYLEPCAGGGSFVKALENNKVEEIEAYDINPCKEKICSTEIIEKDWLKNYSNDLSKTIVVSNPPFGFMAKLAIDFCNKAMELNAPVIAFILPKTFKKKSTQDSLNLNYKLKKEIEIVSESFELNGETYKVPCVFQIWEKSKTKRKIEEIKQSKYYSFIKNKEEADLAIRRTGGRAGQVLEGVEYSPSSTYFIKIENKILKNEIKKSFQLMNIEKYINNTAGVRSISKNEINQEMNRILKIVI
jgi:predicted RNA methylase